MINIAETEVFHNKSKKKKKEKIGFYFFNFDLGGLMPLPPLGPLCNVDPLFICTMVISRGYKKLEMNRVINIPQTEVFHNRLQKKNRDFFSTLT